MKQKVRILLVLKTDSGYVSHYINRQASLGYHLKYACEPLYIFEEGNINHDHYVVIPRKNYGSLSFSKEDVEKQSDYLFSSWRFHFLKQATHDHITIKTHFSDIQFYLFIYWIYLGIMFLSAPIMNILQLSTEILMLIGAISFVVTAWVMASMYAQVKEYELYQKLQKWLVIRNAFLIGLGLIWMYIGYMTQLRMTVIVSIIGYMITLIIRQCYLRSNNSYRKLIYRSNFLTLVVLIAFLFVDVVFPDDANKQVDTCKKKGYVITLHDLGLKAKTTDCSFYDDYYNYQESDQLYTDWTNEHNLTEEDKENILSNSFYYRENKQDAEVDYEKIKQSYSAEEIMELDPSWKVDAGFIVYGETSENLIILKKHRVYSYRLERNNHYDGDWMKIIKDRYFK